MHNHILSKPKLLHLGLSEGKGGVRQPVTKWIQWFNMLMIKPAVADINTFIKQYLPRMARKMPIRRFISPMAGKGVGQSTAGANFPEDDISDGVIAIFARVPRINKAGNTMYPRCRGDGRSRIQNHNCAGIDTRRFPQILVLRSPQMEGVVNPFMLNVGSVTHAGNDDIGVANDLFLLGCK